MIDHTPITLDMVLEFCTRYLSKSELREICAAIRENTEAMFAVTVQDAGNDLGSEQDVARWFLGVARRSRRVGAA